MSKKLERKTFSVGLRLNTWIDVPVIAGSLIEAVNIAKDLNVADYVTDDVSVVDNNHKVISVYEEEA